MASPTQPTATAMNRPRKPSLLSPLRFETTESETIELIPTESNKNRTVSLAISETTLQDSTRSRAGSLAFSDVSRDSSGAWDNYRHVSLATDTTRNSSAPQNLPNGGNRHFSKQSLLSTSQLILDEDPGDRAINHSNRLWTRK
jgi:hypothetical protein